MHRELSIATAARIVATTSALVTGIVSFRLFAKYLDPHCYGIVLVALQVMACLTFVDGGFRTALNRSMLAMPDQREKLLRFGQTLYSWLLVGVGPVLLLAMGTYALTPLASANGQSPWLFLSLGATGGAMFYCQCQAGLLVGLRAQTSLFLLSAILSWINLAALWVGFGTGAHAWAFPIAMLASAAFLYPCTAWLLHRLAPGIRLFRWRLDEAFGRTFHELKGSAWTCFRSQFAIMLLFNVDILFVSFFCRSPGEVATYGILTKCFVMLRGFIQAAGEAAWPLLAERGHSERFSSAFFRLNAWGYGCVLGAAMITVQPFIGAFMGESWSASPTILYLLAARFLITGAASPASYLLIGLGEFRRLAQPIERELVAACVLAVPLGSLYGVAGVAAAFLAATVFGTGMPLVREFTSCVDLRVGAVLRAIWMRLIPGFLLSVAIALWMLPLFRGALGCVIVGAIAAAVPLALAGALAVGRLWSRRGSRALLDVRGILEAL